VGDDGDGWTVRDGCNDVVTSVGSHCGDDRPSLEPRDGNDLGGRGCGEHGDDGWRGNGALGSVHRNRLTAAQCGWRRVRGLHIPRARYQRQLQGVERAQGVRRALPREPRNARGHRRCLYEMWYRMGTMHWNGDPAHEGRAHGKELTRIGEAQNPGPVHGRGGVCRVGDVSYRDPAQDTFYGAVLPGTEGERREPDKALFSLVIDSTNGTSWGPIRRYLLRTSADLALCQEHHLGPGDIPAAAAWALRHGWQPIIAPAQKGEGEGWRGGVAIFARRHLGISAPRVGAHELVPARAVAALVEAPGHRPFTAVSLYLEHGGGLGQVNIDHIGAVGRFLGAQGHHVPFVLGGDFQNDPADVAALGFARETGSSLVATRDPRGTCRSARAATERDFYFIHNEMVAGLRDVAVVEGAGTTPHTPVRLRFHP
jgi:hypothetical protein